MLFNSPGFLFLFFPPVIYFYYRLGRSSPVGAFAFLSAASLLFYAIWSVRDLGLITASISFNYFFSARISRADRRARAWLCVGLAFNLSLLIFFKYSRFFLQILGADQPWARTLVLPLAISFYTFQQISYLVHIYQLQRRGSVNAVPSFYKYTLFILFFPHLIAGPIVRDSDFVHQIEPERTKFNPDNLSRGLALFAIGLAKKMLVADHVFAPHADLFFGVVHRQGQWSAIEALAGTFAYTMQIYFDFSGYSDMAVGLASTFNFHLPVNFNSPYRAESIADFWRRWHMTLSNFLRDFLYIPLGGNRLGRSRTYANLMITMLLGGLWHGASWNFVLWGGLHGGFLSIQRAWPKKLPRWVSRTITFLVVMLAWIPFRAETLIDTQRIFLSLSDWHRASAMPIQAPLKTFLLFFLVTQLPINSMSLAGRLGNAKALRRAFFYLAEYLISPKPILAISSAAVLLTVLVTGYYKNELDYKAYEQGFLRTNWAVGLIDDGKGSYRQNFLNTTYIRAREKSADRQIAVVGSSFATELGETTFSINHTNYRIQSLAGNGNEFDGSLRTIGMLMRFRPHAILVAFNPLNLYPTRNLEKLRTFSPLECVDAFNEAAPEFSVATQPGKLCRAGDIPRPQWGVEPLAPFLQVRSFFKSSEFNYGSVYEPPMHVLGDEEGISRHMQRVQDLLSIPSTLPKPDVDGARDSVVSWRRIHPLNLLDENQDFDLIFGKLKQQLDKKGIQLIIYSTPTIQTKGLYPEGYFAEYQRKLAALAGRHNIPLYDLSGLLPEDSMWMNDFVHSTVRARQEFIPVALASHYLLSCKKKEFECY